MSRKPTAELSRRERQIMEIIYARSEASAAQVLDELPDPPSYSAVRAFLRILEEKGHLTHPQEGAKYFYRPVHPRQPVAREALGKLMETFFGGRPEQVVAALLSDGERRLSNHDLDRLSALIDEARRKGEQ